MATDPDFLGKVFTPAFFVAFSLTLVFNFICCPILFKVLVPHQKRERLGSKKSYLFSLLPSTIHALVTFILGAYILITGELWEDKIFLSSPLGYMTLQLTLGYVTGDVVICFLDPDLRLLYSTFVHHFAMLAGITVGFYHQVFMFFVIYRLMSEFSTPWVNFRWTVYSLGDKKGKLYLFASLGMTISFFLSRIAPMPWHTYVLHSVLLGSDGQEVPILLRVYMIVNFTIFDLINLFWFYKILKGAYKLFKYNSYYHYE